MNTRILAAEYEYLAPQTLAEALSVLAEKEQVRILAGGTDLIVKLKTDAINDMRYMLDIKHIKELDYIRFDKASNCLLIGALARLSHIEKHAVVLEKFPALSTALHLMASISVRNMGTMAGNICNASPVADSVIPAICHGATIILTSKRGAREVVLKDFFKGPGITIMEKDELLTEIRLPAPQANTGSSFIKKTRVRPDIAKISVGITLERDGNQAKACHIAMAAIAATPAYLKAVGESFVGKPVTEALLRETANLAAVTIKPIDDNRTTAEYRTSICEVVTYDALKEAWLNAGGEL